MEILLKVLSYFAPAVDVRGCFFSLAVVLLRKVLCRHDKANIVLVFVLYLILFNKTRLVEK